jgi:hypothetical protein
MTTDPRKGGEFRVVDDPYSMWDAAYVLGSLSSNERREFESHLDVCNACRAGVADLSGMPALLALLDRDEMATSSEAPVEPPPLRPEVFDALLAKVNWRRRRVRWSSWTVAAAAAAVLALGVLVAVGPSTVDPARASQTSVAAMTMAPVVTSELAATFTLTGFSWGTKIDLTCTYVEPPEPGGRGGEAHEADDKLAMVAVGRDGGRVQLATWKAREGTTALPTASTSMSIDEIAALQVVSADTGSVLLQRNL